MPQACPHVWRGCACVLAGICWNRAVRSFLSCGCLSLLLACCAVKKDEQPAKKEEPQQVLRLVARVESRPGNKDFVLLESYGRWTLSEGEILFAYGSDGRVATLVTSGEKLGQFVAADVKSGKVEIGDAVYHRAKGAADAPPPPAPEAGKPSEPTKPPAEEPAPAAGGKIEPVPLPSY
jgi:hypothetical protein